MGSHEEYVSEIREHSNDDCWDCFWLGSRNLHFLAPSCLYIAIFAPIHLIYKIWYRTKRTLLDESPLLPHVEIAKKDPDLPEKPKSKWSKNNILCS